MGLKMTQQSWLLLFAFLAFFFFHFVGHLAGFISVGRVFGKVFRILRLDEKKGTCRWVVEQDFSLEFLRQLYIGLCRNWIVLILVWFERSLHPAQASRQSCPWLLKLMTSQAVEKMWVCIGGSETNGLSDRSKLFHSLNLTGWSKN